MYLLDTNIWLERLLDQEHAEDVSRFLEQVSSERIFITDFSFHSICLILTHLKRNKSAIDFADDLFIKGSVGLLTFIPKRWSH